MRTTLSSGPVLRDSFLLFRLPVVFILYASRAFTIRAHEPVVWLVDLSRRISVKAGRERRYSSGGIHGCVSHHCYNSSVHSAVCQVSSPLEKSNDCHSLPRLAVILN